MNKEFLWLLISLDLLMDFYLSFNQFLSKFSSNQILQIFFRGMLSTILLNILTFYLLG